MGNRAKGPFFNRQEGFFFGKRLGDEGGAGLPDCGLNQFFKHGPADRLDQVLIQAGLHGTTGP
jgi:hypothetical protein